jgi:hypothetical protein
MNPTKYLLLSLVLLSLILLSIFLLSCSTEKKAAQSNSVSELVGFWKTEYQYTKNLETDEWGPGIIYIESNREIKTTKLVEPVYVEIRTPLPEDKCPEEKENEIEQYLVLNNNCYLIIENQLQLVSKEGTRGNYFADWTLQNDTLEMIHTFSDPTRKLISQGISISKTISKKVTKEEAESIINNQNNG